MTASTESGGEILLGAGRAGRVFLVEKSGEKLACKVFFEDKIANLIHYFFFGTPNPYVWNEDALLCAYYRRQILGELVKFWFASKLRIASAISSSWNEKLQTNQMLTELIEGRPVRLLSPFNHDSHELDQLVQEIMKPLQNYLIKSGFDGIVWQAGKGSPSALNNFLLEPPRRGSNNPLVFVCIDMESGVPALFPLNILTLFSFYLPKSFKYKRALFDDVDTQILRDYVEQNKKQLEAQLGQTNTDKLVEDITHLDYHQKRWKSMKRLDCSLHYNLTKGKISLKQADWYTNHPLVWYGRELSRFFRLLLKVLFVTLPLKILKFMHPLRIKNAVVEALKMSFSPGYRLKATQDHITKRIKVWQEREQLTAEQSHCLSNELYKSQASEYINDFGVHFLLKLAVKVAEFFLVTFLFASGMINAGIFALWVLLGGPAYRTIYTIFRMIQAGLKGQSLPWTAFWLGLLPTVGLIAYPCQMINSAVGKEDKVAQFIVYDFFTSFGERFPAWGGQDTHVEHFFNHWAEFFLRTLKRLSF